MELRYQKPIDEVSNISVEDFKKRYLLPERPVILKGYFKQYTAFEKWTIDFFKQELGDLEVGLFHDGKNQLDRSFKKPHLKMKFAEYLNRISGGPMNYRLFLFNPFKIKPDLRNDFSYPKLTKRFLKKMPFMFFGGKDSVVRIHQDMDWSNVFLTQLCGRKKVILFDPKYSEMLYRYPFNVHSPVDIENPDYGKYPALRYVEGMECILEPGDTLFIPSGYWHYIKYLEGGYAVNWRALSPHTSKLLKGLWHVLVLSTLDDVMRSLLGDKWFHFKTKVSKQRAEKYLKNIRTAA